eukprot:TRINITY_DN5913_c0_g1_i1.p1 TRINITY_DN5913_c0_g1~~TRINITY_DN5913_c0_g1_i1.p1  ORF type:complete len:819 (-),score=55.90 TRINITY_DN5913_c0_g1_i1:215-2671(-)
MSFVCNDGTKIRAARRNDGFSCDCPDCEDEEDFFTCHNGSKIGANYMNDGECACPGCQDDICIAQQDRISLPLASPLLACPSGYFLDEIVCQPCEEGMYSEDGLACLPCRLGATRCGTQCSHANSAFVVVGIVWAFSFIAFAVWRLARRRQQAWMSTFIPSDRCYTGRLSGRNDSVVGDALIRETRSMKLDVLERIAQRGFSLGSLLEFQCLLLDSTRAMAEIEGLADAYERAGICKDSLPDFSWYNASESKTWEVVHKAIEPLTQQGEYSGPFASVLTGGAICYPQCLVSHTWANIFAHTVAACVADVLGEPAYYCVVGMLASFDGVLSLMQDLGPAGLSRTFWICAVSINQHLIGCNREPWSCPCGLEKITDGPNSEIGAFDHMMERLHARSSSFYQLIAVDKQASVVTRIWVVAEIAQAHKLGLRQKVLPYFPLPLAGRALWNKLHEIDVARAEATEPKDKNLILAKIPNQADYNKRVVKTMASTPFDYALFSALLALLPFLLFSNSFYWRLAALFWTLAYRSEDDRFRMGLVWPSVILHIALSFSLPYIAYWKLKYGFIRNKDHHLVWREYMTPAQGPRYAFIYHQLDAHTHHQGVSSVRSPVDFVFRAAICRALVLTCLFVNWVIDGQSMEEHLHGLSGLNRPNSSRENERGFGKPGLHILAPISIVLDCGLMFLTISLFGFEFLGFLPSWPVARLIAPFLVAFIMTFSVFRQTWAVLASVLVIFFLAALWSCLHRCLLRRIAAYEAIDTPTGGTDANQANAAPKDPGNVVIEASDASKEPRIFAIEASDIPREPDAGLMPASDAPTEPVYSI